MKGKALPESKVRQIRELVKIRNSQKHRMHRYTDKGIAKTVGVSDRVVANIRLGLTYIGYGEIE